MTKDVWDDPYAKKFLADAKKTLLPKLQETSAVLTMWSGKTDPKIAVELGYSILLGKPIVLLMQTGTNVPERLASIADGIVEYDELTPDVVTRAAELVEDVVKRREGGA